MDYMNWKIIFGGSFLIVIAFASFIGYQFIQNRNNILNLPEPSPLTQFSRNPRSYEESEKAKEIEGETHKKLIRGKVVSYNPSQGKFTIAAEQKDGALMTVIGIIDVSIDYDNVNEYLCWPERFQINSEKSIDITTAFIPMSAESHLYIKGETKKNISAVDNDLNSDSYVFAVLESKIADLESIIESGSSVEPHSLKQLAIIGCNE